MVPLRILTNQVATETTPLTKITFLGKSDLSKIQKNGHSNKRIVYLYLYKRTHMGLFQSTHIIGSVPTH